MVNNFFNFHRSIISARTNRICCEKLFELYTYLGGSTVKRYQVNFHAIWATQEYTKTNWNNLIENKLSNTKYFQKPNSKTILIELQHLLFFLLELISQLKNKRITCLYPVGSLEDSLKRSESGVSHKFTKYGEFIIWFAECFTLSIGILYGLPLICGVQFMFTCITLDLYAIY